MKIRREGGNGRYSEVVEHNGILYLAGQVADDIEADMATQTAQVLASIDQLLEANGSDKKHLLTAVVYVNPMKEAGEMNKVWEKWIGKGNEPARISLEALLYSPKCKVEIMVTAAKIQ